MREGSWARVKEDYILLSGRKAVKGTILQVVTLNCNFRDYNGYSNFIGIRVRGDLSCNGAEGRYEINRDITFLIPLEKVVELW